MKTSFQVRDGPVKRTETRWTCGKDRNKAGMKNSRTLPYYGTMAASSLASNVLYRGPSLLEMKFSYSPFTLYTQNGSATVWTGSLASVNADRTVPSRIVPHGTIPHRKGGPDWCRTVPLAGLNSSILLASSSTVIFSELIGVSDAILSHSTSSHHTDDCEMLQNSCGTLAVNRRIKSSLKQQHTNVSARHTAP